jgi:hypothetical protein
MCSDDLTREQAEALKAKLTPMLRNLVGCGFGGGITWIRTPHLPQRILQWISFVRGGV